MKLLSFGTWLLGSRFTAPPLVLALGYYVRQWWQAGAADNTGYFAVLLIVASLRAAFTVQAHRQWRADWKAMAPGGEARSWRPKPTTLASILLLILIGMAVIWASGPDAPPQLAAHLMPGAVLSAALGIVLVLARLIWRLASRWRGARMPTVALAIHKPVHRVPSIRGCYRRLPPYCKLLLKGGN